MKTRLVALVLFASSAIPPAFAVSIPADTFIKQLYAAHTAHYIFIDDKNQTARLNKYFSPELVKLIQKGMETGNFDFDPLFQGNSDPEIHDFKIGKPCTTGSTTTVSVSFKNYKDKSNLTFVLRKANGSWKVFDIKSSNWDFVEQLKN